jgi:hypothetical protein
MTKSLAEKAREYSDRALATINEIMEDPFAEDKDRLKAASDMLDRGHGKATQAVIAIPSSAAIRDEAAKLSRADLLAIINRAELPRLRHEAAIDGEFEVVSVQDPLLK